MEKTGQKSHIQPLSCATNEWGVLLTTTNDTLLVLRAVLCFLNTFNSVYYPQTFNHPWLNFQSTFSSLVHVIAWFSPGFLQEIVPRQSDNFGQALMEASLGIIDC